MKPKGLRKGSYVRNGHGQVRKVLEFASEMTNNCFGRVTYYNQAHKRTARAVLCVDVFPRRQRNGFLDDPKLVSVAEWNRWVGGGSVVRAKDLGERRFFVLEEGLWAALYEVEAPHSLVGFCHDREGLREEVVQCETEGAVRDLLQDERVRSGLAEGEGPHLYRRHA